MARTWQLRNELWQLPEEGALLGILNVTPDSFSDGGEHNTKKAALAHAKRLIEEGADAIDVGGESTRPGAEPVAVREEQRRVLPVIRALRKKYPTLRLSIDTRNPATARAALKAGADIVNDVTGLSNPEMLKVCAEYPCGIVLMHMKGTLLHMPDAPYYHDIVAEVRSFFEKQVALAEEAGIAPARICLDPGIGFSKKTLKHNLDLINNLESLRVRDLPLLMGLSRKRFLDELYRPMPDTLGIGITLPSLEGLPPPRPTIGMSMLAADNGADVHRVHDIAPHRKALHIRAVYCVPEQQERAAREAAKRAALEAEEKAAQQEPAQETPQEPQEPQEPTPAPASQAPAKSKAKSQNTTKATKTTKTTKTAKTTKTTKTAKRKTSVKAKTKPTPKNSSTPKNK